MKQKSKRNEIINKNKEAKDKILQIETDEDGFKQQNPKLSKQIVNANKQARLSQKMQKVSIAYGNSSVGFQKRSHTRPAQQKTEQNQLLKKNTISQEERSDEQNSTITSMKCIEFKNLCHEFTYNQTSTFNPTNTSNDKFCSIEPRQMQATQIRVENKKNTPSPTPVHKTEQILSPENDTKKSNLKTGQITLDKQKIKNVYDKIRGIRKQETKIIPDKETKLQISSPRKKQLKSPYRNKDQSQEEYLNRLTGKSRKKIEERKVSQNATVQQLLSGKVSIIWIFALKCSISPQVQSRITQMYNPLVDQDKAVPLMSIQSPPKKVRDFIRDFVNIPNCYFKIVTDLQCAEQVLGFRIYNTVIQFYILNQKGNESLLQALEFKNVTRKVKGIFTDWAKILDRAEQQIEEQISIYKVNTGLQKRQRQRKFPNFLKLTDTDKTQATLYRINLYGSIKLLEQEKKQNYDVFMRLVLNKYGQNQDEQQNIQDYIKIDHSKPILSLSQAKSTIQFYVRESFYYQVLNSMLRTMKTSEQFKPCILPFNQTYQSIKLYYQNFLKQSSYQIPAMTLYRGCKISKKDFKQLKAGIFVEMFGFMSTSKSEQRAREFVDRDGYLFVIHVKSRKGNLQKFKNFDHGFVDINRYGLATEQFAKEQEVLFNALNVYQVQKIQVTDDYTYIHLAYGVVFDLLQKPRQDLTQDEYETLVNYHYCTKILGKIEDQGDVFLFANQLSEAKQYYDKKIKQGANLAHNYFKLANVQKQCGEIDQAQKNANRALKLYGDQIDLNDREKCLKVFGIHSKNAEISLEKQDYLTADEQIDQAISMLSDDQIFQKGVKLRQRGQIKFKKGQVKNAEKDFEESEYIFQNLRSQGSIRKVSAYKTYYLSHLSLFCSEKTRNDLKSQLKEELNKVKDIEHKISQINQDIQDQMVKINKSLKDVSLYVEDREKYEIYVKKAQSYLYSIQARQANDPQLKAKMLSMQAMINDYQELAETQKLMNEAIKLIQSKNPFDIKVADYSKILAKMQKSQLQKFTTPGKKLINQRPQFPIPYDSQKRRQIYQRCKTNFTKTLNVLLYHAKDKASPQILDIRNQLGQLTFGQNDFEQCEKIIKQARQGNQKVIHSQTAKTLVTMAKICYARGQLKNSFQTLNEAYKVLEDSMVNKHQKQIQTNKLEKYKKIFQNSDTYLTIKFVRINIYHKQKNHDLAIKSIVDIQTIIYKKVGLNDSHPLLADLYEAKGCSQVFRGNIYGFDKHFLKAISLREKQFGYYHPVNAKCYCAYAKFLIMVKDQKRAKEMLQKAVQIISAFDQSNPHYWALYYSQGFFSQDIEQYERSQAFYQKSLKWAKKHFNKSHIAIKQIMLRYAGSLNKTRKIEQSMQIYDQLEQDLQQGIRQSNKRVQLNEQTDDQKVSLKKLMYSQLSQIQVQQAPPSQSYISTVHKTAINSSLYRSKLNMLRKTYKISENNNSGQPKYQFMEQ